MRREVEKTRHVFKKEKMNAPSKEQLAKIFDEWARQYAEEPEQFGDILDEDGHPVEGYGEKCAVVFDRIRNRLSEKT